MRQTVLSLSEFMYSEFMYIVCSRAVRHGLPLGTEDTYMNSNLLEVSGLHVSAGEKEILHGVDLTVGKDETCLLYTSPSPRD